MQYLGIDVSKDRFDVALILDEAAPDQPKYKCFDNNDTGFGKLIKWLSSRASEQVHAAMEATNTYWEKLAEFLSDKGFIVSVVNPSLVKNEAKSWALRHKTDKSDAYVIARYCAAKKPKAWVAPSVETRELRDQVGHLFNLQEERQCHKNRLSTASTDVVRSSIEQLISFLDAEINEFEKRISDHIDRNPGIKKDAELLASIPGVGKRPLQ